MGWGPPPFSFTTLTRLGTHGMEENGKLNFKPVTDCFTDFVILTSPKVVSKLKLQSVKRMTLDNIIFSY